MAYRVAQLRKSNNITTYMEDMTKEFITVSSSNTLYSGSDLNFTDLAISSTGDTSSLSVGFRSGQSYYLNFSIRCIYKGFYSILAGEEKQKDYEAADALKLTLQLRNSGNNNTTIQQIGTCEVPIGITDSTNFINAKQYVNFSFVFSPYDNFDQLVFRIQRDKYDVLQYIRNWTLLDLDNQTLIEKEQGIKNLLSSANQKIFVCNTLSRLKNLIPNNMEWLKFGYQGRPGSLIVINGEPIIVGRSGIYEFNNGLKVTNFMLAGSTIDAFLLDYAYEG